MSVELDDWDWLRLGVTVRVTGLAYGDLGGFRGWVAVCAGKVAWLCRGRGSDALGVRKGEGQAVCRCL